MKWLVQTATQTRCNIIAYRLQLSVDGGGGVWYEHDVSEDEDDAVEKDTRDSDEENTEVESISSQDQDDN